MFVLIFNDTFTKRIINWRIMSKYTFVLSPFGNGMVCHRMWEALCLGCIPILRAPGFKKMFENLPILIVDNWFEVNQELLDKTILEFKIKTFQYEKLSLKYWRDKIQS